MKQKCRLLKCVVKEFCRDHRTVKNVVDDASFVGSIPNDHNVVLSAVSALLYFLQSKNQFFA